MGQWSEIWTGPEARTREGENVIGAPDDEA